MAARATKQATDCSWLLERRSRRRTSRRADPASVGCRNASSSLHGHRAWRSAGLATRECLSLEQLTTEEVRFGLYGLLESGTVERIEMPTLEHSNVGSRDLPERPQRQTGWNDPIAFAEVGKDRAVDSCGFSRRTERDQAEKLRSRGLISPLAEVRVVRMLPRSDPLNPSTSSTAA